MDVHCFSEWDVDVDGAWRPAPGEEHYDAKVTVLGEYVDHHVQEEHKEMFPKARRAKLDMAELGKHIMERKEQVRMQSSRSARNGRNQSGRAST